MPLVTCPDCGKRVSDKAESCPNCGCPISEMRPQLLEEEEQRIEAIKAKPKELAALRKEDALERPTAFTAMIVIQSILILIGIIFVLVALNKLSKLPNEELIAPLIVIVFFSGLGLTFLYQLYMWKKRGFWGLLVLSCINFILAIIIGHSILTSLISFLWVGALYAVMQLKTHGEKVWDLLVTNIEQEYISDGKSASKKIANIDASSELTKIEKVDLTGLPTTRDGIRQFRCTGCTNNIVVSDKFDAGLEIRCRHCGEDILIPKDCYPASSDDHESYLQFVPYELR